MPVPPTERDRTLRVSGNFLAEMVGVCRGGEESRREAAEEEASIVDDLSAALFPNRSRTRTVSRWNPDQRYGYGWWIRDFGATTACFAWGYGGQYIFVFRDLDLVVVTTSSTTDSDERRGYRRGLFDLVEREVLAPVAAAADAAPGGRVPGPGARQRDAGGR